MKILYAMIIIMGVLLFTGCSGSINTISAPAEGKTVVDGNASEWNNMTPIKNENVAVGFRNDNEYIYIAMVTNDRNKIMKIVTGGLEIWLEPNDSDYKLGIKYPERPDPADMMRFREQRKEQRDNGGNTPPPPNFLASQKTLSIINEDGSILKEYHTDGNSYQAKITLDMESFCYELRVPIGEGMNVPEGLKTKPGEKVQVEFITGNFMQDMQRRRPDSGGPMGMPSGGGGVRMGGHGPDGQGGPERTRMSNSGPLNYLFDVTLH